MIIRNVDPPNHYGCNSTGNLKANIDFGNYYNKAKVDTTVTNQTYTNSENIDVTNTKMSLNPQ